MSLQPPLICLQPFGQPLSPSTRLSLRLSRSRKTTGAGDSGPLKEIAALKGDRMDCILLECGHSLHHDFTVHNKFSRFHDTHSTHLRLPQGERSVVDQMDQDPLVAWSVV